MGMKQTYTKAGLRKRQRRKFLTVINYEIIERHRVISLRKDKQREARVEYLLFRALLRSKLEKLFLTGVVLTKHLG